MSTRAPGKSASSVPQFDQINDALNSIWLSASDVRVAAAPSGVRTAQVDVANNDFRTRHFSYRFEWSDGSGMMIESQTNVWQNGAIPSGGMLTITSVAPNINAANFKLMVRRSD
ncbi:MAG: DUF1425 domain-containing protein [Planctomycetota bacterium]|nr:DUF1425 domain-containing protein [Planctomycetota bacterium]